MTTRRRPGTRRHLRAAAGSLSRRAARHYTSGPTVADAIELARRATAHGARTTIGAWTAPDLDPTRAAALHRAAILGVRDAGLDAIIAVKAAALGHRRELIDEVVTTAIEAGTPVCFDAHGPEDASATHAAAGRAVALGQPEVGIAVPSRWHRSPADVRTARAEGWAVRLIKGQWADDPGPDVPPGSGMLLLADQLRDHQPGVRVATHDAALAEAVLGRLLPSSTPVEVELLIGYPLRPVARVARRLGLPVRIYVPFGAADPPYEIAEVRRDPTVALRLARDVTRRRHHG